MIQIRSACLVLLLGTVSGTHAATNYVAFDAFYFKPNFVTIHAGDTVVWTNAGIGSHTVTGTGSDPVCGLGTVGAGCEHQFSVPGTYSYQCNIIGHAGAGMTGVVQVLELPVAATPAVLTNMSVLSNGYTRFTVLSTAMHTNLVQASTNIAVSDWTTISTIIPPTNAFIVTDSNAGGFQLRFYRVVQP